jgi:hypothetical protein
MKLTRLSPLVGAIFSLIFALAVFAQETAPKQIESTQLQQTLITPVMETPIVPGKNLIYCSTFQIAWNMLQDTVGGRIEMEGQPEVVNLLNKRLSTTEDISEDCYEAACGEPTRDFWDGLYKRLKDKFGENAPPGLKERIYPPGDAIVCYAYLYKGLYFPEAFDTLSSPLIFKAKFDSVAVKTFGREGRSPDGKIHDLSKQVMIVDYNDEDNFIVSLKSRSEMDEIVLAKISPKKTFLKTIEHIERKVKKSKLRPLPDFAVLKIPKIDFNIFHRVIEVMHRSFLNPGWEDWWIEDAYQWIKFLLNEKGVELKSEALILAVRGAGHGPPAMRLVFDKPFLIYLKQKGAKYPYFAMWVDNAELMVKYNQ